MAFRNKELVIAVLLKLKLKESYANFSDLMKNVLAGIDREWEKYIPIFKKTGVLNRESSDLINDLSPADKVLLIKILFNEIYKGSSMNKHPEKNIYMIKISGLDRPLFYIPEDRAFRLLPTSEEKLEGINVRNFEEHAVLKNLPNLLSFLDYMKKYGGKALKKKRVSDDSSEQT